jgi:hypothetical protein
MKRSRVKPNTTLAFIIVGIIFITFFVSSHTAHAQTDSVDLIWESPQSQVPPHFKGKALHAGLGNIQVVAIPNITDNGESYDTNELRYEWTYNSLVHESDSGIGENVFEAKAGSGQNIIQVKITNPDNGETLAIESVNIPVVSPELLLYQHNKRSGTMWQKTAGDQISTQNNSATIVAFPYYLPYEPNSSDLLYEWSINNDSTARRENKLTMSTEDYAKENDMTVSVKRPTGALPNLSNSFMLMFE